MKCWKLSNPMRKILTYNLASFSGPNKNLDHFSICACHPCAGAMLIFSVLFQSDTRVIIVVVQVGAVKIYVAASSGGAHEKGKTGWNSIYHQNWWFSEFKPRLSQPWMLIYFFFLQVFEKSHPLYDQTQGSGCVFLTLRITLIDQTLFITALFKVTYNMSM